tara:strand:- start:1349 stop:1927 length:579 start_codon:yes stop_codon:yes gene_type:complete
MIRLAIIGDIGSGKSHVAKKFGYPVFNADNEVSKLYKKSRKCYLKLKKILPNYITSFPIKKSELSRALVTNSINIKKITKIVHPEVQKKMKQFIKKNKNKKFIVLDIPLFIENKLNKKNDILIYVQATQKEINKRLKKRLNFNHKIVKKLKKFQLPLEIKKKKSDFIIKNNFKNNSIKKSVKIIKKNILLNA